MRILKYTHVFKNLDCYIPKYQHRYYHPASKYSPLCEFVCVCYNFLFTCLFVYLLRLGFSLYIRLVLNLWQSFCLFPNAGNTGMSYHACLWLSLFCLFSSLCIFKTQLFLTQTRCTWWPIMSS